MTDKERPGKWPPWPLCPICQSGYMTLRNKVFDCGCGYAISEESWLTKWRENDGKTRGV